MDIEGLESFLTVVKKKSISKAAAALHITQPTLSTRIRKLEESLGFPLLERSWEGVSLSEQGDYFLPYAIQFLRELSYASTVVTDYKELLQNKPALEEPGSSQEKLRIGINVWLAPVFTDAILTELNKHFPHLDCQFFTKPTNTLKDLLQYKNIHMGIFYQNERKTGLCSQALMEDQLVLLCSEEDGNTLEKNIYHTEKLHKPLLLLDNPVLANNSLLINSIRDTLNITQYQIFDNLFIVTSFIAQGKGYTILPSTALYQIANLSSLPIRIIPLGNKAPSVPIHMEYDETSSFIEPIRLIEEKLSAFFEEEYAS